MSYSQEYVDQLCYRADIVDVVRCFVPLRTRGSENQEHVGLCPFHKERTPSFIVHSRRKIWHCFGCGWHGGVVRFLMLHQEMTYHQAIRWLADRYHFYPKQWQALKKKRQQKK